MGLFFLLELATLLAFSYWGFLVKGGMLWKTVLGIGTPLLVALFWGMFVAPKAVFSVTTPVRIILQVLIFGLATVALYFSGSSTFAVLFGIVTFILMILMYGWIKE